MTGHDKQRAINELNTFIEHGLLIRYGAGAKLEGHEEGHQLGLEEGRQRGLEEGMKKGLEQGIEFR